MLLFVGFWLAGPRYVHVSYVGPTYLGIILQGPGPGLGACLFLCPPGVSAGGVLAAQVWQGKGCFSIILGPKPVRWRACLFLCPAGISAGGWKRDISSTGLPCSHAKGPFQPVHPRLAPFHSKLAISFQTGSILWMKLPFFTGMPPQNPRLRGGGFGPQDCFAVFPWKRAVSASSS